MSGNTQTVDIGDIERGNHEPLSQRDAPQGSASATPSSQTPVEATPPQDVVEASKEAKEIAGTKPEAQPTPPEAQQTKPEAQQAPKPAAPRPKPPPKKYSWWVLFRLYFNTYRYESFFQILREADCNKTSFTVNSSYLSCASILPVSSSPPARISHTLIDMPVPSQWPISTSLSWFEMKSSVGASICSSTRSLQRYVIILFQDIGDI
jgi:hypothetical protein